jgi:HK97 gp10 family phage protein
MANDLTKLRGGRELQAALNSLPVKIEKNIMRAALRAGAKVIAEEAKALVPVSPPNSENARLYGGYTGALKDSIRVDTRARRGKVTASVKAGGKRKRGTDVFYAHFVEFGTAAHTIKGKNGRRLFFNGTFTPAVNHPGARAKPFMRPALDTKADDAIRAVGNKIKERLTKQGINTPASLEIDDES